jgi:hypothetical protein
MEQEASTVLTIRRVDAEEAKELFYQKEDYLRFRADFALFKAQAYQLEYIRRLESTMRKSGTCQAMPGAQCHQISPSHRSHYRHSIPVNGCAMMA